MAIAVGQTSKGRNASSATVATAAVAVSSGSTLVVGVVFTVGTFTSLADNAGNTYTLTSVERDPTNGGSAHARMYRCENCIGNAALVTTLTVSGATAVEILLVELTGAQASSFDQTNSNSDTASPYTSPSITTTSVANQMLVSLIFGDSGSNPATHAESTGFTVQSGAEETNGASFWTGCIATRRITAIASYNSSFTESGATAAAVFIASFKEAANIGAKRGQGPGRGPQVRNRILARPTRSFASAPQGGAISGTDGITFGQSGTLTGVGALAGTAALTFAQTGALTGAGALAGTTTLTFAQTGSLTGAGVLAGTSTLIFAQTGALTGTGALSGTTTLVFGQSGTLTQPSGAITGTTTLVFGQTGTLTGAGALSGTSALTFAQTGSLLGLAPISGTIPLTFAQTGALAGSGALSGTTTIVFGATGTVDQPAGVLAGTASMTFGATGTISFTGTALDQNTGGFYYDFDRHREARRRRKRREEEARREADEIQAELDREIARELRKQDAIDADRADLARIQKLADEYAGTRQAVPRAIAATLIKAQEERSRNALEQLQREMERLAEEEDVAALLIILNQ